MNVLEEIAAKFENADPFRTWWPFIVAGAVFIGTIVKAYMSGQYCPNSNMVNDLVILITGADGGIGSEIVQELSKRGGHIIMCCRNIENGEKVKKKVMKHVPKARIDIRHLDLRSFDNVRELVKAIESDYSKVDVVINNAGLTFHPFAKTSDGFETHLQVNYLSHFLLTHLLMPMLRKSKQGRIINVAAHAYASGKMSVDDPLGISNLAPAFHPRDAFAHSKLSIVMWTRKLAQVLASTAVTVNCLTPGLVRGTKHMRQSPIMKAWSAKVLMLPWMFLFMKPTVMGAQTAIYLATDALVASTSGKFFNDCEVNDVVELAKDERLADKLYAETLRVLKLDDIKVANAKK